MAKQLNVSLAFTANTNEAIAAIKKLQKELNGLATGKSLKDSGISQLTPEIQRAMVAAGELQAKLESATNLKTGKLDLSQFSDSLKKGGVSLQQYANQLNALGPAGRQAFTSLASSIIQAEAPLIRCSQKVKDLGTTLANTARWQISSSILHSFMGTVQSAYSYAQDLNKSLNDIRIVTGASVAEMDAFAAKANKAARALSTTTNEYAKASLIYFQQGDTQAQAMDKAAITTKMANVTGQSAEVVSNQLTAIWNNFNKEGDVAYEHYADVLTKLGAATASSTDEIAGGLEKFAGIADQIGLSYEYAASALATITATSRESEEVVGTALKTIFARIQGLNLGETLDDGTTLNKYSEALHKVGINIFDQAGELKDMDAILEEMSDKWKTLSRDQQTALAQTVAGVRQYNQLMTLMNNWDVMDSNLAMANSADGELNKQAEIYAEGWEAARDRVSAAAENLYTQILDDDFFIEFLNGLEKVISGVSSLIDAFGGLKGVLLTVGAFATRLFQNEISRGLHNLTYNLKQLTSLGKKEQEKAKDDAIKGLQNLRSGKNNEEGKAENEALSREVKMQEQLREAASRVTEEELKQLQIQMDLVRALDQRAIAAAKSLDIAKQELQVLQDKNRLQTKMDAQTEARKQGKTKAGEELWKRTTERKDKGEAPDDQDNVINQAMSQAREVIRSKHNLASTDDLSGYVSEVQEELVNQVKNVLTDMKLDDTAIAETINNIIKDKIQQAIAGAKLNELGKDVDTYQKQITAAGKLNAQGKVLSKLSDRSLSVKNAQGELKTGKELDDVYNQLKIRIDGARQAAEGLRDETKDSAASQEAVNTLIGKINTLSDSLNKARGNADELQKVLDNLNSPEGLGNDIQETATNVGGIVASEAADGINQPSFDMQGQFEAATNIGEREIEQQNASKDVNTQVQELDNTFKKSGGAKDWTDDIAKASNVITGVGAAISSVQGAIDVFSNPDATGWDKFSAVLSIIMGLVTALPPLFELVGTSGAAAGAGMTAAMGPVGWIILAIVAAIAAVVAAFSIWDACTVSAAEKTERLTANVQNMKDAASEAREEAEGLKNAFDDYKDLVTTLQSCTVGTTEWKTAMEGVKSAIDEILETYPDLAKIQGITKWDEDTQSFVLDETKVNEHIDKQKAASNVSTYGSQMAQGMVSKNKAELQWDKVEDTVLNSSYSYSSSGKNGLRYLQADKLTGNKENDMSAIYDAIRNDVIASSGILLEHYAKKNSDGSTMFDENGNVMYDEEAWNAAINTETELQMEAQSELIEQLFSIAETYRTINNEASNIFDNATKVAISEKFAGQNKSEAEMNAAAAVTQKAYDEIFNELYGEDGTGEAAIAKAFKKGNTDWESLSDDGKEILTRYQEAVGHTIDWSDNLVQGNDANRTFHINGQEEGLTPEEIATTIAAYEALGGSESAAEDQKTAMNTVSGALESANITGDALINAITSGGDKEAMSNFLSGLTQEQMDAITNGIDENGNISEDVLKSMGLTPDQLTKVGEIFGVGATEIGTALLEASNTISNFTDEQQAALNETVINTANMTIGNQKAFATARNKVEANLDEKGIASDDIITKLETDNADNAEGLTKFYEGIASLDLQAEGAAESVQALAEEYDVEGTAVDNLISNISALDQTFGIATDDISKQAASLKEVVGEGLNVGDSISDENMKILEDAGINVDQYFTQMTDGTYTLTGKAEEFNAAVNRITFEGLKKQWEDFSKAEAQVLEKYNNQAYNDKIRDTSSVQAGDDSGNEGYNYTEYGAGQLGKARLDYINSFADGTFDFSGVDGADTILSNYAADPTMDLTPEQLQTIADMIDVVNQKSVEMESQMFSTATSLSELNQIAAELTLTQEGGSYSLNAYGEGLINLASKYDNCETEIQDLQEAMMSGDEAMIQSKIDALELATTIGELSEKYGLDAKDVETHAKLLRESAEGYELTAEQAANLAVANRRMNKGVKTLHDNWKDWSKILKTSNRNTMDYADTLNDAHEALADLVGAVDAGSIPLDFLDASTESGAQHLEWMEKAAQGDAQAINQLGVALTAAQVDLMTFDKTMAQNAIDGGYLDSAFDLTAFDNYKNQVLEGITALQTAIQDGTISANQNITDIMDGTGASWVDSLNAMAMATGMSVEEMNAMLNQLGVQAKVDVKDVKQKMKVPTYTEVSEPLPVQRMETTTLSDGTVINTPTTRYSWRKYTIPGPSMEVDGVVQVAQISTEDGSVGPPQIRYTGTSGGGVGGGVSPSATPGGGGGGSTKAPSKGDKTHQSDTVERYKEVKDIINELGREMKKLENESDELWGKNRINNIQAQIKKIDEETEAIKRQRDEAAAYMNSDMADVQNIASQLGVSFTFNDGYITNYEDVMNTLHNQLAAAEAEYNSFYTRAEGASDAEKNALAESQASYEETVLGPLREQLDLLETALGRYDESAETWRNSVDQIEENARKQRALQFQAWTESLELEIGLKQDDIEMFEHLIDLLSDNFYEMAEAIAYMVGTLEQLESGTFGGQMGEYLSLLDTYQTKYQELLDKYAAGEISQADFVAGLDKLRDEVMSNASALKELDQTMFSYYGDTLAAASDELATYTDLMAHSSSVLEHYSNILNILGKSNDYDKMGAILKGQADTAKHQMEVSEAWYTSRKLDAEEQARLYEQAKKDYEAGKITAAELDMYEQKWIDAQTAANEAQDQMLEDAAAWAEALRAVLENKLAKFGQVLENELTRGFGSFDAMMTAMDRASSLQEEYLTTTNQIYETNKLMRKAQQEIDKSTNSVAKQRLKQFATETSALQNKTKLSQYELEIQQAKYELVLAEIALEEAQQSKSTVRLQRDSEGNFGYVYTADQSKLAEAQQQLEDAQNSLYNIGLEGANDYSQKYAETMQEMYDTLTSIQEAWLNGEYETQEEYNKAMTEAQQYYYQKLQDYSSLYQVAITTDSRVVKDAWSSDFSEMTYCTEEWQNHITSYVGKVTEAFGEWQYSIAGIEEKVGTNLSDIESNVSQLTHSSEDLADTTVNDLIPALNDEILAVHNLTNEYAGLRQTILDAIAGHNSLLTSINASKDNEAEGDGDNNNSSSSSSNNNSSSSNSPSTATSITSQNSNNNSSSSSSSSNNSSSSSNSTGISTGQTVTVKASAVRFASGETMWSPVKGNRFRVMAVDGDRVLIGDPSGPNYTSSGVTGWVNKKDLEGFDTGGYTGAWGPYGKLALLHEKELVLNQEQTKDLLYTMEFLDKILQTLDLQAVSSQVGGLLSAPYFGAGSGEVLEQNVHIEASFPGVQDRNEIEEAFNMLINQASQYANRK